MTSHTSQVTTSRLYTAPKYVYMFPLYMLPQTFAPSAQVAALTCLGCCLGAGSGALSLGTNGFPLVTTTRGRFSSFEVGISGTETETDRGRGDGDGRLT